jgi:hypothetical protein
MAKSSKSPTQRTREYLRKCGITSAIVERWNPHARLRQDLFGFADLLALQDRITAIQVTSTGVASRIRKIKDTPEAAKWLASGGAIEVHGWRRLVAYRADGTKAAKPKWSLRVVKMSYACGVWLLDENSNVLKGEHQ